ncbi:hypothetical protein Geob_1745 [Geotalea daltonii FRC-32]|uniref:Uncharacterized protein n=1 Tax=Geotalea daltonii (strain DSM 22248 / JCM 15807 / FRC-32) TaxID=316067 RepID=B9M6P3_GEODF|nr:hypothetical protein [Geotalea daltonii]ACM20103.1 hypothetical protein Geob_1745 [Geotalea daltonii FRC-32]
MTTYHALRQVPAAAQYKEGDVLVLCGELFGRGYANGIVDEARKAGMTIIGTTVGRRDGDGTLRSLNGEELAEAEANIGGKIINIPLEAGFDMEPCGPDGRSIADQLKGVKPDDWEKVSFDWNQIEQARQQGARRFKANLGLVADELARLLPSGANVIFAHTMAGGIPRARIFMPLLNRVFKGQGERFLPSETFWKSDLGKLCKISFDDVTGDTFRYLIDATAGLRDKINGRYTAYGYHGCEVLIDGNYTWQSYTPYLQGWAKIRLEEIAEEAWKSGIKATVFNCPEILTNSSALFLGVENSLYMLLAALEKEAPGPAADGIRTACLALLADGITIDDLLTTAHDYLTDPLTVAGRDLSSWPQHNSLPLQELMLNSSAKLIAMNRNPKEIVCAVLSQEVFRGVGRLMFDFSWMPDAPVVWLNHDVIAKRLATV